jgi:hypothetical protein
MTSSNSFARIRRLMRASDVFVSFIGDNGHRLARSFEVEIFFQEGIHGTISSASFTRERPFAFGNVRSFKMADLFCKLSLSSFVV